jgi:hypothetical protein
MKRFILSVFFAITTVLCMAQSTTQSSTPTTSQTLVSEIQSVLNVPLVYEFKPEVFGILGRAQVGSIKKFGCDIDALAGLGLPTKNFSIGTKSFSDLTGQAGVGGSWKWTYPKTAYFLRAGVGVLQKVGGQPFGSIYVLIGNN